MGPHQPVPTEEPGDSPHGAGVGGPACRCWHPRPARPHRWMEPPATTVGPPQPPGLQLQARAGRGDSTSGRGRDVTCTVSRWRRPEPSSAVTWGPCHFPAHPQTTEQSRSARGQHRHGPTASLSTSIRRAGTPQHPEEGGPAVGAPCHGPYPALRALKATAISTVASPPPPPSTPRNICRADEPHSPPYHKPTVLCLS